MLRRFIGILLCFLNTRSARGPRGVPGSAARYPVRDPMSLVALRLSSGSLKHEDLSQQPTVRAFASATVLGSPKAGGWMCRPIRRPAGANINETPRYLNPIHTKGRDVCCWHFCDITRRARHVGFRG